MHPGKHCPPVLADGTHLLSEPISPTEGWEFLSLSSCPDLFLKSLFLVLLLKPMPGVVTEGGLRNEGSPSLLEALPRAEAIVLDHHLGDSVVVACHTSHWSTCEFSHASCFLFLQDLTELRKMASELAGGRPAMLLCSVTYLVPPTYAALCPMCSGLAASLDRLPRVLGWFKVMTSPFR